MIDELVFDAHDMPLGLKFINLDLLVNMTSDAADFAAFFDRNDVIGLG